MGNEKKCNIWAQFLTTCRLKLFGVGKVWTTTRGKMDNIGQTKIIFYDVKTPITR